MAEHDPLGGYGTKYGDEENDPDRPAEAKPIRVYKVEYQPKLSGRPNAKALPPPEATASMELAERELPGTRGAYRRAFEERTGWWFAAYLVLGALGVIWPAVSGVNWTAWSMAAWLLASVVLIAIGHYPVRFFRDWFYTTPQLLPATRREHPRKHRMPMAPSLTALAMVAGSMTWLQAVAPLVAAAVFGLFGSGTLLYARYGRLKLWTELLPLYACYGRGRSGAPGVWRARQTPNARRTYVAVLYVVFCLLGAAVSMRVPWEQLLEANWTSWTTHNFWNFFNGSPAAQ